MGNAGVGAEAEVVVEGEEEEGGVVEEEEDVEDEVEVEVVDEEVDEVEEEGVADQSVTIMKFQTTHLQKKTWFRTTILWYTLKVEEQKI